MLFLSGFQTIGLPGSQLSLCRFFSSCTVTHPKSFSLVKNGVPQKYYFHFLGHHLRSKYFRMKLFNRLSWEWDVMSLVRKCSQMLRKTNACSSAWYLFYGTFCTFSLFSCMCLTHHKVRIHKDLKSTTVYVPSSELGLSQPLSRQRVCPSLQNREGAHSPAGEGLGESQSDDWRKSLALCLLCAYPYSAYYVFILRTYQR